MTREIDRFDVQRLLAQRAQLVEVLPSAEYQQRHIAGAVNLPLKELGARAPQELDPDGVVITYCYDSLCDMSGRAAARLESLGFREVYNYAPSKVDWFANSLPAEGSEADRARLAHVARRDVPTCRLGETVADVRPRLDDWDVCLVVDQGDVLLGLVRAEALAMEDARRVDELIQEGVQTHRPDVTVRQMADMLAQKPEPRVIVTNADGTLVGVASPQEVEQAAKEGGSG